MRVAFALTQSLDSPSGLGRYGPIAHEMVRLGYDVEIYGLHYDWANLESKRFLESGVTVAYVGQMHVRKQGPRKLYYRPAQLMTIALSAVLRLALALRRSSADVIHLGKPQPINVLAARLARLGRPIYCDCDDYEAATNRFSGRWQQIVVRYFEDSVTHYAAGLTINTHFTRARYEALGYPGHRIVYVPNGVERSRFMKQGCPEQLRERWGLSAKTPVILYVGTISTLSHSVDLLLSAFAGVHKAVPNARLVLVGGGEDYDRLQAEARALGLEQAAVFAGRVSPEEIPAYFGLATVSVDPVRDDLIARARSPLKALESLVMGVPVVTGDVGDRAAMLGHGEFGVLVKAGDSDALAQGLLALLTDPDRREEMSRAALAAREQWFWDHLVEDFVRVYRTPEK